jgi:hypothetical protein
MSDIQMMFNTLITRVKGFVLTPVEAFQQSRTDDFRAVLSYFIPLLLFQAILYTIIALLMGLVLSLLNPLGIGGAIIGAIIGAIMSFFIVLIGIPICAVLLTIWLHILTYLAGGRQEIFRTFKAVIYGMTPSYLLGWIPIISYLSMLISIIYTTLGIRELQEISTERAIIVMVIAIMVPVIIAIIIAVILWVVFASAFLPNIY